jgi:DNA-binding protein HU-beta
MSGRAKKEDIVALVLQEFQLPENENLGIDSKIKAEKVLKGVQAAYGKAFIQFDSAPFDENGTFNKRERAARIGRNPRTREEIQIPASKTITFKAYTAVKEKL